MTVSKLFMVLMLVATASYLYNDSRSNQQNLQERSGRLLQRIPNNGNRPDYIPKPIDPIKPDDDKKDDKTDDKTPGNGASISEWAVCTANKCGKAQVCVNDRNCNMEVYKYSNCVLTDSKCIKWNSIYQTLTAEHKVPEAYFACQESCSPDRTLSEVYYTSFDCKRKCAAGTMRT